jgi:hypothetical protein
MRRDDAARITFKDGIYMEILFAVRNTDFSNKHTKSRERFDRKQ